MHALSIENLTKHYRDGPLALKGVSFDVPEGEFFGLLGPNGAGKSTMIGIVSSLVRKSSGSVSVFGHDLYNDPMKAKSCIGLVPQEFNFSLFEKVIQIVVNQAGYYGIPRQLAYERAEKYLKELSLWDKRNIISRKLSGGMKRRLMIARALLHEPRLLILDEPTAGVDIEIRRSMWSFLRKINEQGTTIILTTHYLEEAESLCRQIAIIDEGEIIEHTDTKSLLRKLDKQHIVLDLRTPLRTAPEIPGFVVELLDNLTLDVELSTSQDLNDVFTILSNHGVQVSSMRNRTNRLEELFVSLIRDENHDRKRKTVTGANHVDQK